MKIGVRAKALVVIVLGAASIMIDPPSAAAAPRRELCASNCQYLVNGCSSGAAAEWCGFWMCNGGGACDVGDCTGGESRIRCCTEGMGCIT